MNRRVQQKTQTGYGVTRSARIAISAALLVGSAAALAEKPRFNDTLTLSVGGMSRSGNATLASTRTNAVVDKLTLDELDLDDDTDVFWADLAWQISQRWQFRMNYSSFQANGAWEAIEEGNFDDLEWTAGAKLTSSFDMELYIAELTWDFLKSEKGHLGAGVGVHAADLDVELLLELSQSVGGSGTVQYDQDNVDVLAPLPNVSVAGGYRLRDSLYLSGRMAYFSLNYDQYEGEVLSARAALEWRPWRHLGFGLAYQYVDLNLGVEGNRHTDLYDLEFYGPVLFFAFGI